ncbi:uncharacterized protein LOC107883286 isoform X2 [Acyrthosiphon pisum]|uniref:Uncharacterized protein n=1 Tax=Acyrthosiphon pisum TaxID=7029 RepID=A0A8R2H4R1_ACYPI|nr:uncharacterized protein LOC107883286 isoform X2 [Acyrthosiphon pisum]|eukprot:XP_016658466.1 PREDICTED: uncharacterized protein LOC107883286 isoform X2 [Acyrthosiphon pisum]
MDILAHSESIVGKSFEYWKNLYDQGIIDHHAIQLRLNHLKYALNHKFITNEEYDAHQLEITSQYDPSYTDYKPCSLMNFCKALKTHFTDNIKINKPFIIDKHSEELTYQVQKCIINTSENINQQNGELVKVYEYHLNEEPENNNNLTEMPKKSRKKRKRKKKFNNNDCKSIDHTNTSKTFVTNNFKDECDEKLGKSIVKSKNTVKIFIRQMNNKDKSQIDRKESFVSNQICARYMFSNILKKFKKEKIKMQC